MPESSLTEVLAQYEADGFPGQFSSHAEGVVRCRSCRSARTASSLEIEAMHRFEGQSDPEEEAVIVALHCPSCGTGGTIVLSYGPESSREDARILMDLGDGRKRSPIPAGV